MNKKTTLFLVITVLMLSTVACSVTNLSYRAIDGNGILVEETREVGSFDEILLSGIGSVYVEYGSEESLVIEAEENLIEYIEIRTIGSNDDHIQIKSPPFSKFIFINEGFKNLGFNII